MSLPSNNFETSNDLADAMKITRVPPVLPPFNLSDSENEGLNISLDAHQAIQELKRSERKRLKREAAIRRRKRQRQLCAMLFFLTFVSTTLIGADYWPLDLLVNNFDEESRTEVLAKMDRKWPPEAGQVSTVPQRFWQSVALGCTYSCPLMIILLCHEMGHFLQTIRNRVPASFPYFIPLPLPPLGTMGAVILQGPNVADRKKMFDIAISGPLAGLIITIPVLYFGIKTSEYTWPTAASSVEFGRPLLVSWLIDWIHGPAPVGMIFHWNGLATAGWVGVFVTAMNLLPIGQLDGGHLMYTMVGRAARWIAWGVILAAVAAMLVHELYSYILLLLLLLITGPGHPPTADDTVPLGWFRHVLGWLTLSFLLIGFTPQPILFHQHRPSFNPNAVLEPLEDFGRAMLESSSETGNSTTQENQ